jgi:VIT1/CCC1 family predicted Fe2+/Mn2+ transporter
MRSRQGDRTFAPDTDYRPEEPEMAAHPVHTPEPEAAPESPLLAIFAALIIVAIVPIALVIAVPSTVTLIAAVGTVIAFASLVTWLLARMIGSED